MGRPIDLPLRLLTLCFFGSGLTGLVYELVWTRRLQLVFGSTTYSVTTVLAAFMAGLGIGSYLIGRRVDRSPEQGARIYAYLEIGVAIYAAISLPLISGVEWLYGVMQRSLELSPSGAALLKLALAFPVLALPAGMMGGTLPALVRATVRRRQGLHRAVGRLYGVNTIGAAVGTLLTGMLLIELLGLWRTVLLSATVNAGIGILVLSRLRAAERAVKEAARHREGPPEREEALEERERAAPPVPAVGLRYHLRRPDVLFCALAVVLTGVLSMSYEVVWTRLLGLVMGSSTYAFTIVLGIFLVGIASGALLYSRIARGREPSALGLAQLLCALAIWVALTLAFIPSLPRMLMALAQLPGLSFSRVLLFEIVFATALLLVPTLLLGAALPMAMGIVSRALGQIGRDVGGIYLANTLGAIAGSVLTGFLLVPWLGCQRTLVAGLVANVILVGVGFGAFARRPLLRAFGGAIAALIGMMAVAQAPWPAVLFDSGLAYRLHEVNAKSNLELEKRLRRLPNKLLFRSEGVNATISVRQFEEGITLLVNGKPDASTSTDMATQVVLGGLAALIHPAPRDVNIVGWGSGVTARTVSLLPEVRRLDVIEIERAVLAASRYFHPVNGAIERDKRVKVYYDDARSFYLTNERRYDVIISEPSNPWMVGVSGLFSADFYALAKRRLKPGGIFGQWLQLYRVDARAVALVLRTVRQAFRHVQLWLSDPFDVMLVASDSPIRPSRDRIATAYRQAPELARLMAAYGPGRTPDAFFGCYLLGEKSLARVAARLGDAVMTDDRPVLEYRAVRDIYRPTRHHLRALMSLKLAAGDILPPLAKGSTPPALGAVIAGAAALLQPTGPQRRRILAWSRGRVPDVPVLVLERARRAFGRQRFDEALRLARTLETSLPHERWLLEGRVAMARRDARGALAAFDKMGTRRPVARWLFTLRAALGAGDQERSFAAAEALLAAIARGRDPDALRIARSRIYDRELRQLLKLSRDPRRMLALLRKLEPHPGGEIRRLVLLLSVQQALRMNEAAAKTLDRIREFRLLDERLPKLCEPIYKAAGRPAEGKRCLAELGKFFPKPLGEPLWKAR